ncbi:hypothetical protein RB195_002591 [Necator americanus]|uniref:Uncharacterized protein n=2 Tax=Necator americanus TaxID=51031 RepID=A0ABR1DKH7_NECAM
MNHSLGMLGRVHMFTAFCRDQKLPHSKRKLMLHKNLKVLKRSISEKILRKPSHQKKGDAPGAVTDRQSSSQSSQYDEDPYREILRTYNDNVSHLVFHGSSLKSMSSIDFGSMNHSVSSTPTCHVRFDVGSDMVRGRHRTAMNA